MPENKSLQFENDHFRIDVIGEPEFFWLYHVKASGETYAIAAPSFEVGGVLYSAVLKQLVEAKAPQQLSNGCNEYHFTGLFEHEPNLALDLVFRLAKDNPVVRFHYTLRSKTTHQLTKIKGSDALVYLQTSFANLPTIQEVRFSEFNELFHSFCLSEHQIESRHFERQLRLMGPMLTGSSSEHSMLVAYEHGSQVPDAFIEYGLDDNRAVTLKAVKGNYFDGQLLTPERSYQTIWMQMAALKGTEEDLAKVYRTFVLKYLSLNQESRKPYIFYNTWAYQERNKWWNNQTYLASMHQERILQEIDIAYRMGIEVFVIDTGWYQKTGDWRVNLKRFPDGLKAVKAKLDSYGMKLGLWFNPTVAALSSQMLAAHPNATMRRHGKEPTPQPVWETEESKRLCLVSDYGEAFADELIRLVKELGVTYFKWDAIGQYGCDHSEHWHGTESNSERERADCYAFELIRAMTRVVDKVCAADPEVIVDFDITESGRCVGLSFFAAGKYFLNNNGPYYHNYDIPLPDPQWTNIFVRPGPARTWICRSPLTFDKWIPSVLFLTHYLPDDPADSQLINIASLILGHNGIWGDLLSVSTEGVVRFHRLLSLYKQVRNDITSSYPVRQGDVGGTPEVHEKVSEETGRGAIVVFSNAAGSFQYVSKNQVSPEYWHSEGVTVELGSDGRANIGLSFDRPEAKIIFFGVKVP